MDLKTILIFAALLVMALCQEDGDRYYTDEYPTKWSGASGLSQSLILTIFPVISYLLSYQF